MKGYLYCQDMNAPILNTILQSAGTVFAKDFLGVYPKPVVPNLFHFWTIPSFGTSCKKD